MWQHKDKQKASGNLKGSCSWFAEELLNYGLNIVLNWVWLQIVKEMFIPIYLWLGNAQALKKLRVFNGQLYDLQHSKILISNNQIHWEYNCKTQYAPPHPGRHISSQSCMITSVTEACFVCLFALTSLISLICWSSPPIMSYVESGTFSTFIRLMSGSTLLGRIKCKT